MSKDVKLTLEEVRAARKRRLGAMHLQRIEGNPLSDEDVAMFEMFDRERWSFEKRAEHIRAWGREQAKTISGQ